MYSLREWQTLKKDVRNLIVGASVTDGTDTWVRFPIGTTIHTTFENLQYNQQGPHDKTVLCSINTYTDKWRRQENNRESFVNTLTSNGIPNQNIPFKDYQKTLTEYKFVVSPEGNGIDCHRHYEALISGCIPIVEDNPLIREKYKGCPILYTKDYTEITEEYLEKVYLEIIDQTYDFTALFLSSYTPDLQRQIKINSRFWSKRYGLPSWYPEPKLKWLKIYK